jgi:broad specificity polyphosphatase/5'/3'-nucleotidase SurE
MDIDATDTDLWAIKNGYVSVVPSCFDLTHYYTLDKIDFLED